jgi:hypothetical protein
MANHRLNPIQVHHPRQRWTGADNLSGTTTFLARTVVLIQGGESLREVMGIISIFNLKFS